MKLTISMATYNDYDGVYFTIQSIRLHHNIKCEFIVLDNNPLSKHSIALKNLLRDIPNSKYIEVSDRKSSWVKYDIFKYASGDIVLGLDSHVLLETGFFDKLFSYFSDDLNKLNMLTGPVVYNKLDAFSSFMEPIWRGHDFGCWANNPLDKLDKPFEIPMQGMGCFAVKKDFWPTISTKFKGFGSEEWYIAERIRQNGGKVFCHPKMKWVHRFDWPQREFPLYINDKIFNYYVGWLDLYKDINHPMIKIMTNHWEKQIGKEKLDNIISKI